jgi:hypothetical protein
MTCSDQSDQRDRSNNLAHGSAALASQVRPGDTVIIPATASTRVWVTTPPHRSRLSGRDGAIILPTLVRQIGSLCTRGTRSTITSLGLVDVDIPGSGRRRLNLEYVSAASIQRLGELFEVLATVISTGSASEADLDIDDPNEQGLLIQALRRASQQDRS